MEVEILLVDDNSSDADMVIRVLRKNNLAGKLLHLKDGVEALDFIFNEGEYAGREVQRPSKVVLLDLKMPRVGGIEVLKRIKADERTRKIPVVVLTSSREHSDVQTCYDLGANGYIVKPVEFEEFQKTISDLGHFWINTNQGPHI
ncbi:MAG: response regulator [Bacteroidota bacterium]